MLSAYAAQGIVQDVELRRPVFAKEVTDRNPSVNVGLHNDCFMTDQDDMGTYGHFPGSPANFGTEADAKAWAQSFTADKSFGGETCPLTDNPEDPAFHTERWRVYSNMTSEPAALHMNYLNGEWAADAVSTWESGGCYPEIRSRLGYRFEVKRVDYTPAVASGHNFSVTIDIANSGWARLPRPREAKLVLRSGQAARVYGPSNGATRDWAPGTTTLVSVTAAPPPAGIYEVRLAIPDPGAPVHIPYAVKLASLRGGANVFDGSTGENILGISLTVQ